MPNWCHSELNVSGSKEDIKKFKELFMEDKRIVNSKIIPYPRELELLDKVHNTHSNNPYQPTEEEKKELMVIYLTGKYEKSDGYNQGGYDWCCENWGSKWGICQCEILEETEENINFIFESAWSPSTPLIKEMSKKLPNLTFGYNCQEETLDYAFDSTWKGGEEIEYEDTLEERQKAEKEMYAEDEEAEG